VRHLSPPLRPLSETRIPGPTGRPNAGLPRLPPRAALRSTSRRHGAAPPLVARQVHARRDPGAGRRLELVRASRACWQRSAAVRTGGGNRPYAVPNACVRVMPPAAPLAVEPGIGGGLSTARDLWDGAQPNRIPNEGRIHPLSASATACPPLFGLAWASDRPPPLGRSACAVALHGRLEASPVR
jgi:hypothetical protein